MTEIIITFVVDFTRNFKDDKKHKENKEKDTIKTPDIFVKENLDVLTKHHISFVEKERDLKINTNDHKSTEVKMILEPINNNKVEEEQNNNDDELLPSSVHSEKPIRFLHIEYNLLPGKTVYKIDVVFWEVVAKVYTKDGTRSMKTINIDEHCWVAFSIKHKLFLDFKDIESLKSKEIHFSITTNKSKLTFGEAKKDDVEKTFYFNKETLKKMNIFAEAFETEPSLEDITKISVKEQDISDIQYILNNEINFFPTKTEPISILEIPDDIHQQKVLNICERISQNKSIICLNDLDESLDVNELIATKKGKGTKKATKNKKGKAAKGAKGNQFDSAEITFSGELFFTDPMNTYDLKLRNHEINNSFIFIESKCLLNQEQKVELNPLIINIEKITNIPVELLGKHKFSYIYITYNICNIEHRTGARVVANKIIFYDNHAYFIAEDQLEKLAQVIQNDFLILQIHGIRLKPPAKRCEMFGENVKDKFISTPIQHHPNEVRKYTEGDIELNKKSVLLAVARVRLTDLLTPCWQFTTEERCVHPRVIKYLDKNCTNVKIITYNDLLIENNMSLFDQNPLTDKVLISSGMNIHVTVRILNPIRKQLNHLIESRVFYNRLIIQFLNIPLAKRIIFNIFVHNSHWLQRKNIVPNYLTKRDPLPKNFERNILTGFGIDCLDHCILFIEGHVQWICHLVWSAVRREKKMDIKLMYNSDYVHDKRVYDSLIPYGGVIFICMHVSPYQLMICTHTYVKGHLMEASRRALHKLKLLSISNRLKELPDDLLPTLQELFALSIEWGVPVHWPLEKKIFRNEQTFLHY